MLHRLKGAPEMPRDPATIEQWRDFSRQMALAAAALTLVVVPVYHIAELFRETAVGSLWWQHAAWRGQTMLAALITLVWCTLRTDGRCASVMLRVLSLSIMAMMFGMFASDYFAADGDIDRMTQGLIMTTFAVSVLSVRGAREMFLLFGAPLVVTLTLLQARGASLVTLAEQLFDVIMMFAIGLIVSELMYRIRRSTWVLQARLREHAATDALTGLDNRRQVMPQLHSEIARAGRGQTTFSVIMADLDHFKRVNDEYGHVAGDAVLKSVARILRSGIRQQDRAVRWGGEEFLILLPDTNADQARIVAEKIRETVDSIVFEGNGKPLSITISMGVAGHSGELEPMALIDQADRALYEAKRSGRNRVCVANTLRTRKDVVAPRQSHSETP